MTKQTGSLLPALRWQVWLRVFALAGLAENVLTLLAGNALARPWAINVMAWQLTHDPGAKPRKG